MKNGIKIAAGLLAAVICFALFIAAAPTAVKNGSTVKTVAEAKPLSNETVAAESEEVLAARFLNMLNHNFAYNEVYDSVEDLVNVSMPALLQLRDSQNEDYIANEIVASYIYNMYGVENIDFSQINTAFEMIEGYTYIIPRGFTVYSHQMESMVMNEDGSFTVTTSVLVNAHDDYPQELSCETLFVRNNKSSFGFNIIFSNIDFAGLAM